MEEDSSVMCGASLASSSQDTLCGILSLAPSSDESRGGLEEKVFHFNDRKALSLQDDDDCAELYKHWYEVASYESRGMPDCISDEIFDMDVRTEDLYENTYSVKWLSRYGCAVLLGAVDVESKSVVVVGLDGWRSRVHSSIFGREVTAEPDIVRPVILEAGTIPTDKAETFLLSLDTKISEAQNQKQGRDKHHKTPSWIWARVMDIFVDLKFMTNDDKQNMESYYQGGSTDVGLHTGCLLRNTSFPLVASVWAAMLYLDGDSEQQDFYRIIVMYYLHHLRNIAENIISYDPRTIDRCITVIREIRRYLLRVHNEEFQKYITDQIESLHQALRAHKPAIDPALCTLPTNTSIKNECQQIKPHTFPEPPLQSAFENDHESQMEAAKAQAKENLQWSNLNLYKHSTTSTQDIWVALGWITPKFWTWARHLNDPKKHHDLAAMMKRLGGQSCATAAATKASKNSVHVLSVELRSCEMLCTWITFCWAHRIACENYPVFKEYSTALDPEYLQYLVLQDSAAIDAAGFVRKYLQQYRGKGKKPFYSHSDTLDLALTVGKMSTHIMDILHEQQKQAESQIEERYNGIKETQERLRFLDEELEEAKSTLRKARRELQKSRKTDFYYEEEEYSRHRTKIYTDEYYDHERACSYAQEEVTELQKQISEWEKRPADVFLPLPKDESLAIRWLFFLYMPVEFCNLASLAQLGQSFLWKTPQNASEPDQDLRSWYTSYNIFDNDPDPPSHLKLGSSSRIRRGPISLGVGIRNYRRETGVFYPDSYALCPCWISTDPFASKPKTRDVAYLFTEDLPQRYEKTMKQFLVMLPSPTRGNQGIASLNQKPSWLTKQEYLTFTSLRAYPNLQIRNLLVAISEDHLPFDHECVLILVLQLLFHVGVERWKTDLKAGEGFRQMNELLREKLAELRESPNNGTKLLLFGLISTFLGQFDPSCRSCSIDYSKTIRALADKVHEEVYSTDDIPLHLYQKQAKLYGCALLGGDNSSQSLLRMVELMVLFHHKSLFYRKSQSDDSLENAVQQKMAKHIKAIVSEVQHNLAHLTKCIGLIIGNVPSQLDWVKVRYGDIEDTACFEAEGDHHYAINLLNGSVLVDGIPPGFLPSSILNNDLYKRTFGSSNFECIVESTSESHHFRTAKTVDENFIYEFKMVGGKLQITEHLQPPQKGGPSMDTTPVPMPYSNKSHEEIRHEDYLRSTHWSRCSLILLNRNDMEIPKLLREPHSHWMDPVSKTILFRPPGYKVRDVRYVMTENAIHDVAVEDRHLPLQSILRNLSRYRRLLFSPPKVLRVLQRIEMPKFILAWSDPKSTRMHIQLPRLGLEFCQTDDGVQSVTFSGFFLRQNQSLEDCLPGVTSYIILRNKIGQEKVLISRGTILENGVVRIDDSWEHKSNCHIYDVHQRFQNLIPNDLVGRLQLAGIYAATSCSIEGNGSNRTGVQMALELVRHCWMNEPFPLAAKRKLVEVSQLSKLSCSLSLMCSWIWKCSNRMAFLAPATSEYEHSELESALEIDPLALREYRENSYAPRLQPSEEMLLLGTRQRPRQKMRIKPDSVRSDTQVSYANKVDLALRNKMIVPKKQDHADHPPYPLKIPTNLEGLASDIHEDLRSSWKEYCSLEQFDVSYDEMFCQQKLSEVTQKREKLESQVLVELNRKQGTNTRMSYLSGASRMASLQDLLLLSLDANVAREFNASLSCKCAAHLQIKAVEWMVFCVLEDKLYRIMRASTDHKWCVELLTLREWDPWKHIHWLVFEVEQRLQIRPYQYCIVQQLLETPKSMIQLNMGLGKTSVLVPMLILELAKSTSSVPRINMLSSIMPVVKELYRSILTTSVLNIKIFTLPFQRNFPLDDRIEEVITEELGRCKDGSSCLLVTPQHRNSLLLKQYDQGITIDGLAGSFVDVIDESDKILETSFQLVYATGDQEQLPHGPTRWIVAETLLQLLSTSGNSDILALKCDPNAVHLEVCKAGAFPRLRMLAGFAKHQQRVGRALCKELILDPPHELLWMKRIPAEKVEKLIDIMANKEVDAASSSQDEPLFLESMDDILAIRGCIGCGLLFHCLKARHRVNYGVGDTGKKMAVPFSAADTPKHRADFSHPDVSILYTCLSYYHCGLTIDQFKQGLTRLMTLGPTAQETIYNSWINGIRDGKADAKNLSVFDSILKVDIDNCTQVELMHGFLGSSMRMVSFWMNHCVFPLETHVFPGRRVTSAWNLVGAGNTMGFSGTDDNRFLLPQAVRQVPQSVPKLRATNGEMIDRIRKCTVGLQLLNDQGGPLWKSVLNECVDSKTHALIDAGGLMAGISNKDVAVTLSEAINLSTFRGVVYFDVTSEAWCVLELKGRSQVPLSLQTSSLIPAECFVYYDESRCRGSDLKLLDKARALVTLDAGLTKDKLLQGCARLRELHDDAQSIVFAGTAETLNASSTAEDILEKTIQNTTKKNAKGVMELLERGRSYYKFPEEQKLDMSLKALYSKPVVNKSISTLLDETIEVEQSKEELQLVEHCKKYGGDVSIQVTQLAEECERELENEEEAEEEAELELGVANPFTEESWDSLEDVFTSDRINQTHHSVMDVVSFLLGSPLGDLQWSNKLLCTKNWMNTIINMQRSGRFYLRPVNSFLFYPDGRTLLISDYEADQLLPYWWSNKSTKVKLQHLPLVSSGISLGRDMVELPLEVLVSAKLLCGSVRYSEEEKISLATMFGKTHRKSAILELLQLRHRLKFLERSDLDEFSRL